MSDIIKLLPDAVANQIAAGEVIQRPASAVKELLENAVDAGATQIDIVLKDSGKTLIQVIDNGSGMSVTDARMSFERHATSKIKKADDLFAIKTMGFRGEALASIAAIAQIDLKTKKSTDDIGTQIVIEGSNFISQRPVTTTTGSNISVKNLFFNVPARRNFLKSDPAEYRQILDEFYRVSLIHPQIVFNLFHNDKEIFHLYAGNLKQRIVSLFGSNYNERLLAVNQMLETVSVEGYIVKAEFSRKTRGEQYFFVNQRFIKHPYLHHAIENAFMELLPKDSFPSYFLNITIDPNEIDVNIHPTKTEVNFQNTKLIYAVIHAAVRKTIGQYNLSPKIDFESIDHSGIDFGEISRQGRPVSPPTIGFNPYYNPFSNSDVKPGIRQSGQFNNPEQANWRILYEDHPHERVSVPEKTEAEETDLPQHIKRIQLQQTYILTVVKSGILLIDQHLAHYRVLYEKFLKQLERMQSGSQQELFPHNIQLNASDAELLLELKTELGVLGFNIEMMNQRTFIVNGIPEGIKTEPAELIEAILENYKKNLHDLQLDKKVNLARVMAVNSSIKQGQWMSDLEMSNLIDMLFACHTPEVAPDGRKTFTIITLQELLTKFK
jgi:DNA mismatch repair protein MutL